MEYLTVFIVIAVIVALGMAVRHCGKSMEHEWHSHLSFWEGSMMRRRRPDGSWEYRAMTAAEKDEDDAFRM